MDFSYFKFLIYINKNNKIHWLDLSKKFNLTKTETLEIENYLKSNGYIHCVGDTNIEPTYKGKHFISSAIFSFVNVNIIDILALIVSIIAIIVSIVT